MPFPDKKRVKFGRNPLVEVTCQLTFLSPYTEKDGYEADSVSKVHERVKERFPLFNIGKRVSVDVDAEQLNVLKNEQDVFEFSSLDQNTKIALYSDSVSVSTTNYSCWEDFVGDIYFFLDEGLSAQFEPKRIARIGLRYKDVIQRSLLGLDDVQWRELLNGTIAHFHQDDELANCVLGSQSNVLVSLNDCDGTLSANYGLVIHNPTQESCFMVDSDFFMEGDVGYDGIRSYLDAFNVKSRNFFQWCISETLFQALEPQDV